MNITDSHKEKNDIPPPPITTEPHSSQQPTYYKIIPKNHTAPLQKSKSNPNNELKTTHFSIDQRPLSARNASANNNNNDNSSHYRKSLPSKSIQTHFTKPPIPIKQSYTPPINVPASSPYLSLNTHSAASPSSSSSKYIIKPKHAKSNSHDSIPLPIPSKNHNKNPPKSDELPLGWAKLRDSNGFYYFNVITAEKQRIRPKDDATQSIDGNKPNKIRKSIPNKPLPSPYSGDIAPSVVTDDLSVAEIDYRKNNGSVIFGAMDRDQFIHQENWDMLIDAIYLNLSPSDYLTIFKALRSIAENLFDEDDKYRILYADNKKVQQRILSRIGGYEFLRGLGFRELTKRKLMCEEPDFDVVATAITAINAKLTLLEKHKPLPIIPDHHGINHNNDHYKNQNRQKMNKIFPMKAYSNVQMPSPHHQGLRECMNRQFRQQYDQNVELKELKLDNVISEAVKSKSMQSGIDYDEEEKNEMLHKEEEEDKTLMMMRDRKISAVTNAVYSDCDDEKAEKLGVDTQITDAGIIETNEYFQKKQNIQNRKRSLSFDENMNKKKQQNNAQYPMAYFRSVSSPKNGSKQIQNGNQNHMFRRKKPSAKQKHGRKKAFTQHSIDRRSSSVSSPRSNSKNKKKMSMNAIEVEIDRAYVDTQKKLSSQDLHDEDIESLFDDDDDIKQSNHHYHVPPFGVQSYKKPRDDSYLAMNKNGFYHRKQQSRDDFGVRQRRERSVFDNYTNHRHHNNNNNNSYYQHQFSSNMSNNSSHRHTLPPKNMLQQNLLNNNNNNNNNHSRHSNPFGNGHGNLNGNMSKKSQHRMSPRSMSYGNALQPNGNKKNQPFVPPQSQPLQFLMPSERKKLAKNKEKQKKKAEKNNNKAHKIKQSVGAFFHSFKSKKNPKYSKEELSKIAAEKEEYRKKHKDDDEDYYAYYGDPAQNGMSASPIPQQNHQRMSPNPLSSQFRPAKEMEILFEDEIIKLTPDSNISCVGLIELALAKRGWSSTMSHLFSLCIKGDTPSSDKEIIATLEDTAKVASFPNFISHLNLSNPKYLIVYKSNN